MSDEKIIPVRVALRSRPLVSKEIVEGCQSCLYFVPGEPQLVVGQDKAFTFDYVFSPENTQEEVYTKVVKKLIDNLFKGYNITVLAYGQTGSGKTYSMGTAYSISVQDDESKKGIIPRAVCDIFEGIYNRTESEFLIKVSFLEIHKEEIYDLFSKTREKDIVSIREDYGGIKIVGLTELPVSTPEQTLKLLEQGSLCRTTASTNMNAHSSRSHAIFTVIVEQHKKDDSGDSITAKFHLVDLAGSERAKKTKAHGERFKEGVNINRGLLALGNVISALCDDSAHIPYRDSKLTRLLQDSLGGNSHTVMIACVSPSDSNLDETINTLRYADRARKIKNKPVVNRDPQTAELTRLKQMVQELQVQLIQGNNSSAGQAANSEFQLLLHRNKQLEVENKRLARELQAALDQTTSLCEKAFAAEFARERLKQKLEELKEQTGVTFDTLNHTVDDQNNSQFREQLGLVKDLQKKIIDLQAEQSKKDQEYILYSPDKSKKQEDGEASQISPTTFGTTEDDGCNAEEKEYRLECTLRHAAMSRELQELDKALALKEDLASRMQESECHMDVLRLQYESNLRHLEEEVAQLQKEKEELSSALRAVQTTVTSNKVSEQRRKRLQECETQISQLKKKMVEHTRMLKMKEEADKKVKNLQQEITSMKQNRVRLLRQMKEEAEKYRHWKQEKDREVAKLRQQDRKRQFELVKMEKMFSKQQTVLRRKMEGAVAANRRLQEALLQQKAVSERRGKEKEQSMQGVGSRVRQWLNHELAVVVSSKEAEHHLQNLIDDRKTISEELSQVKIQLDKEEPPTKKRVSDDHQEPEASDSEKRGVLSRIKSLENELELHNIQISDLQQKILDADQEQKSKQRWDNIHSMVEAKCSLQWLFDFATAAKFDSCLLDSKYKECQGNYEDLTKLNEELNQQLEYINKKYEGELTKLAREHEDKTLYLLKQMQETSSATIDSNASQLEASLLQRIKFQENEISRLAYLHEELQNKIDECDSLKKQLTVAHCKGNKMSLMPDFSSESSRIIPEKTKVTRLKEERFQLEDVISDTSSSGSEGDSDDPDWRLTPFQKRIKKNSKGSQLPTETTNSTDSEEEKLKTKKGIKRSVSNAACKCQGNCATGRCGCCRGERHCTEQCKCSSEKCLNRSNENGKDTFLNTTFNISESNCSTEKFKVLSNQNGQVMVNEKDSSSVNPKSQSMKYERPDIDDDISKKENSSLATVGILKKKT
ncbi:kinesin-like protein 3A isoform X2 [Tachypleus tridentatus]|uniref:kinesin-like protein 3A isoform X2 n=1 Tax=Tachypleus tridentatus TaxID=6853 RepID=UPI003FD2C70F